MLHRACTDFDLQIDLRCFLKSSLFLFCEASRYLCWKLLANQEELVQTELLLSSRRNWYWLLSWGTDQLADSYKPNSQPWFNSNALLPSKKNPKQGH